MVSGGTRRMRERCWDGMAVGIQPASAAGQRGQNQNFAVCLQWRIELAEVANAPIIDEDIDEALHMPVLAEDPGLELRVLPSQILEDLTDGIAGLLDDCQIICQGPHICGKSNSDGHRISPRLSGAIAIGQNLGKRLVAVHEPYPARRAESLFGFRYVCPDPPV
jgi:hypothetical protein